MLENPSGKHSVSVKQEKFSTDSCHEFQNLANAGGVFRSRSKEIVSESE